MDRRETLSMMTLTEQKFCGVVSKVFCKRKEFLPAVSRIAVSLNEH